MDNQVISYNDIKTTLFATSDILFVLRLVIMFFISNSTRINSARVDIFIIGMQFTTIILIALLYKKGNSEQRSNFHIFNKVVIPTIGGIIAYLFF